MVTEFISTPTRADTMVSLRGEALTGKESSNGLMGVSTTASGKTDSRMEKASWPFLMAVDMRASGRKDVLEERCHLSFLRCGKALQRRGVDSPSENGLNFKHLYESNCGGSFLLKRLIFRYRRDAKFQFIMIQSTPEYSCGNYNQINIVWCGKVRYKFAVKVVYRCHNILLLNCLDIQEPLFLYFIHS